MKNNILSIRFDLYGATQNTSTGFILTLIISLAGLLLTACEKDETPQSAEGIVFAEGAYSTSQSITPEDIIISYDQIVCYDSTQHVFQITNSALEYLNKNYREVTPSPICIALEGKAVYTFYLIPGYSSIGCPDCITADPQTTLPLLVLRLGYPETKDFSATDLRNTHSLIERLKKDNKLITITY